MVSIVVVGYHIGSSEILTILVFAGLLVRQLLHVHLLIGILLLQMVHDLLVTHVTVLGHAAEARWRHLLLELLLVGLTHVLLVLLHVHLVSQQL
jgi:hypothetical protein